MTGVLAEHIDYLSLDGRAELYDAAIARVLRPGDVEADLGCGFGILGMQCLKAGAARVYGVDGSGAIEIARESVTRAGLADRYHCIPGSTYRIDLPEPVDLVICDHVGWFGFDYDIVPMMEDARRRLLKPGGRILPRRLRLVVAGVSSDKCRALVERWTTDPVPAEYHWLREYQLNTKHPYDYTADEFCTAPVVLGEIDLAVDNPDSFAFAGELVATREARCDGIAGWFECELADGVWMTNSPLADQRIARNPVFLAARESFAVQPGETIGLSLRFRKEGEPIAWTLTPPGGAARQKLSTWNSIVLGEGDRAGPAVGPLALNELGAARLAVLGMVDGQRSGEEIEQAVLAAHPALYPSEAEIRRFVRAELGRATRW